MKEETVQAKVEDGVKKEEPSTVISPGDKEEGLGDDSNAPNPDVKEEEKPSVKDEKGTPGKRKRADNKEEVAEEEEEKPKPKRAGHQIEVVRRKEADEGSKSVRFLH